MRQPDCQSRRIRPTGQVLVPLSEAEVSSLTERLLAGQLTGVAKARLWVYVAAMDPEAVQHRVRSLTRRLRAGVGPKRLVALQRERAYLVAVLELAARVY